GNVFTQTAGSTTVNGGTLSASQINIAGGGLFFETALTGVDGTGAITLSNGGNAEFAASVAGTGPITLTQGSLAEFAASVDSSEQVGFGGGGTIQVDDGFHFAGTLFHFSSAGQFVHITNLSDADNDAHTSFDPATNRLTVFGDNSAVTLQLDAENYSGVSWSTQQDAVGGTFVTASLLPGSQYVFFAPGQTNERWDDDRSQQPATAGPGPVQSRTRRQRDRHRQLRDGTRLSGLRGPIHGWSHHHDAARRLRRGGQPRR